MAGKSKGVCLAVAVDHDGHRYEPGMPVPLPKAEADRLIAKFGAWEGDPVKGEPEPISVAPRLPGRRAQSTGSGAGLPDGAVITSKDELAEIVAAAVEAALPRAVEAVLEAMTADTEDADTPDLLAAAGDSDPAGDSKA